MTAGEFLGFSVPAFAGAMTADAPEVVAVVSILAAGGVEGAALGLAQASVLTRAVPALDGRRWVYATSVAAVVAYAIGLLPSIAANLLPGWPIWLLAGAGLILGTVLLLTIGTAQWLVLRRTMPRSASWIVTTAAAWIVGLSVFLAFATPLWHPGQPMVVTVLIGLVAGLLMAVSTSIVTGYAVRRLVDRQEQGTV